MKCPECSAVTVIDYQVKKRAMGKVVGVQKARRCNMCQVGFKTYTSYFGR